MNTSICRDLDLARLAARERRLRLVMETLSAREADYRRNGTPALAGLRHSIADFGGQLREIHRQQAQLGREESATQGRRFERTSSARP